MNDTDKQIAAYNQVIDDFVSGETDPYAVGEWLKDLYCSTVGYCESVCKLYRGYLEREEEKQAEHKHAVAQGRLIMLPCGVGDTVFVVGKCENVHMRMDNNYITGTGAIECPFESDCEFDECEDSNVRVFETVCTGFMMEFGALHTFTEHINAELSDECWGETVFLTRHEAEAAIMGDGDGK